MLSHIVIELCLAYNKSIDDTTPPKVVLDMSRGGIPSEAVKSFTKLLALPTISASYGQEGDLRYWRNLDSEAQKYLIQVMPPGDIAPEIVRSLVNNRNISNAVIIFDNYTTVMDHKYKSLLQNVPTRHVINQIAPTEDKLREQLLRYEKLEVFSYFIVGTINTITRVLNMGSELGYLGEKYAWYTITLESEPVNPSSEALFLHAKPANPKSPEIRAKLEKYGVTAKPTIVAAFYFDLMVRGIVAVKDMAGIPVDGYISCNDYSETNKPVRTSLDLLTPFKEVKDEMNWGEMVITENGKSYMKFTMPIHKYEFDKSGKQINKNVEPVGSWSAGFDMEIQVKNETVLKNFAAVTVYTVVTLEQKPFVYRDGYDEKGNEKFKGYCIDLLEEIRNLTQFNYVIYHVKDNKSGNMDEEGNWNGMIKDLMDKKAHIALGALSVMAERENVIDFTVPYYDLVGISILMLKPKAPTSLFKFLTVLENEVWLCILAAYFFTSFLMWVFDRWSPYSYQNNREKYKDDEEKREFNLKECLWFCMTSLTPQGGGEAPKNLSGRLVAATWWLFGFIIIASYTANLAAFLTVSRLDTPVESLDDLSKQYKIQYAPVRNSSAYTYFKRMSDIELRFYEIWKDMSLNDSLSEVERAKLAVWDYPVSDKYTKILQAMQEADFPKNMDEAIARVRASKSSSEGFAFIGDASDIRYLQLTNCDLQMVGEEFSRKPYAIAVQQGSPLKDQFNNAILQLLNKRKLEKLKERWWNGNPEKKTNCEKTDDQSDGISIQNIGGVFIVIFVGIALALITLAFEYFWYKIKRNPRVIDVGPAAPVNPPANIPSKLDTGLTLRGFRPRNPFPEQNFRGHGVPLAGVTNPW
ncbi:ionotropic receptor 25a [Anabrus simplex]|uniref:ionotropic receptor 25a n=1 Tax=Anabrus simplex TaxID=316456 RepID=UPI0035A36DAE